jgi:hypothetical protein
MTLHQVKLASNQGQYNVSHTLKNPAGGHEVGYFMGVFPVVQWGVQTD